MDELRQKMVTSRIKLRDSVIDLFSNLEDGAKPFLGLPKAVRRFFLEDYLNLSFKTIRETTIKIMELRRDMSNPYFSSALRLMEKLFIKFKPIFINESFHIGANLLATIYKNVI
jgi:hypothetical protein